MTSEDRKEKRYQRRKAKRLKKRNEKLGQYDCIEAIGSLQHLIRAHLDSRRGTMWKAPVARFDSMYIKRLVDMNKYLMAGRYDKLKGGFYNFKVNERGKIRDIHSLVYKERVLRRSACINSFVPILSNGLILDNGASLKGRGTDFSLARCEKHLHKFYRETMSNEGYVLTVDFKSYFANIQYKHLFEIFDRQFTDERVNALAKHFVLLPGREKGIYIGPEDSQIFAITFASCIDHKIKDEWGLKYYGRYNDDSYILFHTKEEAKGVLEKLLLEYDRIGIVVNRKKTKITKLSHGFSFLKVRFHMQESGKVLRRADHSSIIRQRRKIKKFKRLYETGQMDMQTIRNSYSSWRGYIEGRDAYRAAENMDRLYYELFKEKPVKQKRRHKWTRLQGCS